MREAFQAGLVDAAQRASLRECLDRVTLAELIASFWQTLPEQLGALFDALAGGDQTQVYHLLHTLKGAGSSLGYAAIGEAAHEACGAVREGRALPPKLARLQGVLRATAAADPEAGDPALPQQLDRLWSRLEALPG